MRVWIDALATTNASGRHVLLGHLEGILSLGRKDVSFTVLYPNGCPGFPANLGPAVSWKACPSLTRRWYWRQAWERLMLGRHVTPRVADVLVVMSGTWVRGVGVPQISLAMNPWALAAGVPMTLGQRVKAAMQRHAYRCAVRKADGMVYLSGYLRDAYHLAAGTCARREAVVYASVGADVWEMAGRRSGGGRDRDRIICVSAMAPHKGIETLLSALELLRTRHGRVARLTLVGNWPDRAYETRMRSQVARLGLESQVDILGHLPRKELLECCASAEVFALLSRCESFGIPGVEAQALGIPVVCSNAGAMPEVYGEGALTVPVGDASEAARALDRVLGDAALRDRLSDAACANARRFRQPEAGRLLLEFIEATALKGGTAV